MKGKIFAVLVILVIIVSMFYNINKDKRLRKELAFTTGEVIDYKYYGRTNYYIEYVFFVDNVKYKGSMNTSYFECPNSSKGCIGGKFKIGYSKVNPKINEIDLGKYNKYKKKVSSIFK